MEILHFMHLFNSELYMKDSRNIKVRIIQQDINMRAEFIKHFLLIPNLLISLHDCFLDNFKIIFII